jgi:hypothetical protein
MLKNPETNKMIKNGGKTHLSLIKKGLIDSSTLDTNKVSIIEHSRQKVPLVILEHYDKTTHWTNVKEISIALHCSEFELIEFIYKEFNNIKICLNNKSTRIIFPNKEYYIQNIVNDFITYYSTKNNLDLEYWNQ